MHQHPSEHADRGCCFLADSALRHFYGALARTLASLFDEVSAPLTFDLLSLDVKGNELAVLQGLDFKGIGRNGFLWKQEEQRLPIMFQRLATGCAPSFQATTLTQIFSLLEMTNQA